LFATVVFGAECIIHSCSARRFAGEWLSLEEMCVQSMTLLVRLLSFTSDEWQVNLLMFVLS
jgi:hypothetical protein